jgi:hypothetical protein
MVEMMDFQLDLEKWSMKEWKKTKKQGVWKEQEERVISKKKEEEGQGGKGKKGRKEGERREREREREREKAESHCGD